MDKLAGVRPYAGALGGGVVEPPTSGAWLGAWVRPPQLTQAGRLSAVRQYEKAIGRPLRIVNTYRRIDEPFDTVSDRQLSREDAVLMLSWATGDTRSITLGHSDRILRARAAELRRFDQPVLIRVRWEMDRPNLAATMWSPQDYIASWHHIRSAFGFVQTWPQIKAVSYFESDPDGNVETQRFRLADDLGALGAYAALARTPYFAAGTEAGG